MYNLKIMTLKHEKECNEEKNIYVNQFMCTDLFSSLKNS
jgi:hypothetical protein